MSTDGQGTKRRRKIAENYNCFSRVHERYRRQTDGRATANSECEREFTFANKKVKSTILNEECWWGAHLPYLGLEPVGG